MEGVCYLFRKERGGVDFWSFIFLKEGRVFSLGGDKSIFFLRMGIESKLVLVK